MVDNMDDLTLASLMDGCNAVVKGINGGGLLVKRLSAMGIMPGKRLSKEAGQAHGPVIFHVCGARLALGRGMAAKIIVETEK